MKFLPLAFCLLFFQKSFSQRTVDITKQDVTVDDRLFFAVSGEPFVTAKFVNIVEGTPYFKDEWMKATLWNKEHQRFSGVNVKLDLLENNIHYLDKSGKELIATTPVKQITLSDSSGKRYNFFHLSTLPQPEKFIKAEWFLLLDSGYVSLYKFFYKTIFETRPYGAATYEQHIQTAGRYFVLYKNRFVEISKLKDAPNALADKSNELKEFLKTKDDAKLTMDERFVNLINHYNSLQKQN